MAEWLPLAEEGDAVAQNSVGALYDHGLGVDEDDGIAVYWYQQAADQNLPLAMRNLAAKYASGQGVPYDEAMANSWYEKAAKMGDPVAIKRMATSAPSSEFAAATTEPIAVAQDDQEPAPAPSPQPMSVAGDHEPTEPAPVAPVAPEPSAKAPAMAAADADSNEAPQYGDTGTQVAPAPAKTQQAAVTAPPAPAAGNWLIGMWQGPSLGCPPDGGLEFTVDETHSYYAGQIAVQLKAKYKIAGDRIEVTTTGVDGVGHAYEYERKGADKFVIAAVPPDMPSSMVGVEHRRCGPAPVAAATAPAPTPAPAAEPKAAAPAPAAKPFAPAPEGQAEVQPAPKAAPVKPVAEAAQPEPIAGAQQAVAVPQAAKSVSAQEGWDAFGRGDYDGALAVWRPLAEGGDVTMQLLVGSIYDYGQGVPQDDAEAVKWYERAAAQGSAKGQYQAGAVYARSPQVKDPVQGYKWLTIAARTLRDGPKDGITADQALTLRALIEREMSEADIAKAKQEADAFKPTKG
ncbi:tetratricopeptide repeat protein [Dongia deserti]|uniref:tetratricopeptide repeat protein n=1 Tax=Dongia deserti TaxID=2268030 RepID=UPI0013C5138D|nr:tetratricopeptide repeat protein [Dongia deserti]